MSDYKELLSLPQYFIITFQFRCNSYLVLMEETQLLRKWNKEERVLGKGI